MQGDDHTEIVQAVKKDLADRGVPLSGPCGAFEITSRVAWALRDEGIGNFVKTSGNNCRGNSVDVLVYKDGTEVDILGDSGNANIPQWGLAAAPNADSAGRWSAPHDPDAVVVPVPTPKPGGSVADAIAGLHAAIDALGVALQPKPIPVPVDDGAVIAAVNAETSRVLALIPK